jgi:hypothetical protein
LIEAHLYIGGAVLSVAQQLEAITGSSRKRLITTARQYRPATLSIHGDQSTADLKSPDLHSARLPSSPTWTTKH